MSVCIGILQTDSVREEFLPKYGDYPVMFETILGQANPDVDFRHYNVEFGVYPQEIDECDGYVITGSKKSVYDDEAWIHVLMDFVRRLHEEKKKVVGICFGHQLVAHALGGETRPAEDGWGVGVHQSRITSHKDFMAPDRREFSLLVSHKDQVTSLPDGAELLATSDFCPNAMYAIGDHVLTFQGHPEFTKDYSRDLIQMRRQLLGEETATAGLASLELESDAELVASWIVKFIGN
jgi:GMP synthase-like glutamine amidotransferase